MLQQSHPNTQLQATISATAEGNLAPQLHAQASTTSLFRAQNSFDNLASVLENNQSACGNNQLNWLNTVNTFASATSATNGQMGDLGTLLAHQNSAGSVFQEALGTPTGGDAALLMAFQKQVSATGAPPVQGALSSQNFLKSQLSFEQLPNASLESANRVITPLPTSVEESQLVNSMAALVMDAEKANSTKSTTDGQSLDNFEH